mgnify:CR=1 FL=1
MLEKALDALIGSEAFERLLLDRGADNSSLAATRPRRGTCNSRSLITVISTLSVSSGMRLISSTYNSDPSRIAVTSGPSSNTSAL